MIQGVWDVAKQNTLERIEPHTSTAESLTYDTVVDMSFGKGIGATYKL
jgi:hypothetical protein